MSRQQYNDMVNWFFKGLVGIAVTGIGFVLNDIYNEIRYTHDSVIRLEERSIQTEKKEELWQMHLQRRIEMLESKGK